MRFSPSESPRHPYSQSEKRVLDIILSERMAIDTRELMAKFYSYQRHRPRNAIVIVGGVARSLIAKVRSNREKFVITKTRRCGPHPVSYAAEKRRA